MTTSLRERTLARAAQRDLLEKVTSPKYRAASSIHRVLRARLAGLKAKYRDTYLALHGRRGLA